MDKITDEKHFELQHALLMVLDKLNILDEKIDCILHGICKNDDEKTEKCIGKYLLSNFRNKKYSK